MEAIGQAGNGCQDRTEGAMVCCKHLRLPTGGVRLAWNVLAPDPHLCG